MRPTGPLTQRAIMRTLRERNDALKKLRVKRIGLFGSYARGRQTDKSDLDFLVEFEEPDYDNFLALADYLERLFGRKVDLLTPDGVKGIRIRSVATSIKKSVVYV